MNYDKLTERIKALDTEGKLTVQNMGDSILVTGSPTINLERIKNLLLEKSLQLSTKVLIHGDQTKKVNMSLQLPLTVPYDTESERRRIGTLLYQIRIQRGFSQDTLATMAGITRANLAKMEQGRYNPGLDNIGRVATALGLQLTFKKK